jgi:transposase
VHKNIIKSRQTIAVLRIFARIVKKRGIAMLKLNSQMSMSEYKSLYDIIVPAENILRKIKENIDFSFVNPMLKKSYCEKNGRPAKEPEMMFKLMFLKKLYDLSDESLIQNVRVNMAYKYFLDMNPEDEPVDSSLMTKFRKTRITEDILEEMLYETVRQAIDKGLIKSSAIIVDATHTKASARQETPTQILRRHSKELRKEIYRTQHELSEEFPEKPIETAELSEEIEYSKELIERVKKALEENGTEKAKKLMAKIIELLIDDKIKEIQSAADEDAKLGYKSESNSFFGYKSHMAMTEERIITGMEVTTGEAPDGAELINLIEQSVENGINVEEVLGDTAYSGKENLDYAKEQGITIISKLNPVISNGNGQQQKGFEYNKDADMYQCPAGHLAINKKNYIRIKGGTNNRIVFYFDINKCKTCHMREGCYKEGVKNKTYSVAILSEVHKEQKEFQETEYFKERAKQRYKIEAKNAELKQSHGLGNADSKGVIAMQLQSYFTAFVVNVKRIVKLMEVKTA